MFYGLDLQRLRAIPKSNDINLYDEIAGSADSLDEDELDALKRVITGECKAEPHTEHLYGYALKAICEHIGEMVGEEVAAVHDHPYKSKLVANGPPIDIPYTRSDFPEIGFLDISDIPAEHRLATTTEPRAKRSLLAWLLRRMTGGMVGREMSNEDVAEDMEAYAETLQECMDKNCSLVSFRH